MILRQHGDFTGLNRGSEANKKYGEIKNYHGATTKRAHIIEVPKSQIHQPQQRIKQTHWGNKKGPRSHPPYSSPIINGMSGDGRKPFTYSTCARTRCLLVLKRRRHTHTHGPRQLKRTGQEPDQTGQGSEATSPHAWNSTAATAGSDTLPFTNPSHPHYYNTPKRAPCQHFS